MLDGCPADTTVFKSVEGPDFDITIIWPETNIGINLTLQCPCGNFSLNNTNLFVSRYCGGDFIRGGEWGSLDNRGCNFSLRARKMCRLSQVYIALIRSHNI